MPNAKAIFSSTRIARGFFLIEINNAANSELMLSIGGVFVFLSNNVSGFITRLINHFVLINER